MPRAVANGVTPGDLDDHARAIEELHRQNRELQERVEELGVFAGTIIRHLTGSCGAFTNFASVLQGDNVPLFIKQQQECLECLAYTVDQLNNTVDELLLSYARAMW